MAQKTQLILVLKQALKSHGLTYVDVAETLNLSEASVKRLFAQSDLSLTRLDLICQRMGIEISDLVAEMVQQHANKQVSQLSHEQEQELASDATLLLVTVCVLNGWTIEELTAHYHLAETECVHYLAMLDTMGLITLLPQNRIRLRIATNFSWRPNGPIQHFFQDKLAADFFNTQFEQQHEQLVVLNGMLSDGAMAIFQRKLRQLVQDFDELNNEDRSLPLSERKGTTVVLAARNWQFGLFDHLRK